MVAAGLPNGRKGEGRLRLVLNENRGRGPRRRNLPVMA